MIRVSGESKSRLVKAAGAESCGQRRNQKLHAAVARSTFSITMCLSLHVRTTFWSCDVEKLHAAVARSTFWSENVQNTSKNCTPLWREAHFEVKMYKTVHVRTTFWSWDVEKLHAAVARSTFPSQNVKKLTVSEHFLKLRCWKIARCCGEKHIRKSKCAKYLCFAALFEVQMSKD